MAFGAKKRGRERVSKYHLAFQKGGTKEKLDQGRKAHVGRGKHRIPKEIPKKTGALRISAKSKDKSFDILRVFKREAKVKS